MPLIRFVIRNVRNAVREHRAARRAGAAGEVGAPPAGAEEPTKTSLNKDHAQEAGPAALAEQPSSPPAKQVSPAELDLPSNPDHARTKKLSYYALVIVGFALALDYSSTLMSIQPLFYLVNGPQNLYGLTFSAYDLGGLIFAPVFGYWVDRAGKFKMPTLLGVAANAVGNYIYAFTVLANEWWLMLLARLVAGSGAAVLGIGGSYITLTTHIRNRQRKLGMYRIWQNVARAAGPLIGFIFLGLPSPTVSSSDAVKVFNWYTLPGWIAGFGVTLLCGLYVWGFTEPSVENEHYVEPESIPSGTTPERRSTFVKLCAVWTAISTATTMLVMAQYSNFFALFAAQFHQVWQQSDTYKSFLAAGVGSIAGAVIYRKGLVRFPKLFDERIVMLLTTWLGTAGFFFLIPYKGADWVPPPALFYVGSALLGSTFSVGLATMETFISKKVTQYADVVGDNVGKLMGVFYMALSAGRFAGPMIIGSITYIATPSGEQMVCTTGWFVDPQGDLTCDGPPGEQCGITASDYYVGGCVLYRALPVYAAMAGMQFVLAVVNTIVLSKHWSYKNAPAEAPAPAL